MASNQELEEVTADSWLKQGSIVITETGSENTYYKDQFNNTFFCKNYPSQEEAQTMTEQEFNSTYNKDTKCTITFKNSDGYTVKGLLLAGIQTSLAGVKFVNVNNFYKTVKLEDIISIRDSGVDWI